MSYYTFDIEPRDLLFFRDARPMEASDAGSGGHWPRPDQLHAAFINAFHQRWPEHQEWEHRHTKNAHDKARSSDRFGGLRTAGPWPVAADGRLFLPCPLDLQPAADGQLHPLRLIRNAGSNLPEPLTHTVSPVLPPSKADTPQWIPASLYASYLRGAPVVIGTADRPTLYEVERNIGIAIDPDTHATSEGQFYQAEYLRLREGVKLACQVSYRAHGIEVDVIKQIAKVEKVPLILGGRQGVATVTIGTRALGLPQSNLKGAGLVLRWTLLTPAVFPRLRKEQGGNEHPGGWLPTWVAPDSGTVMLKAEESARQAGEAREAWRRRVAGLPPVGARLIAARIGKPLVFSGWDDRTGGGPRPTQLAVPAGAAYFFACTDRAALERLAAELSWNGGAGDEVRKRRSTVFGEKGYGLGVCSVFNDKTE